MPSPSVVYFYTFHSINNWKKEMHANINCLSIISAVLLGGILHTFPEFRSAIYFESFIPEFMNS